VPLLRDFSFKKHRIGSPTCVATLTYKMASVFNNFTFLYSYQHKESAALNCLNTRWNFSDDKSFKCYEFSHIKYKSSIKIPNREGVEIASPANVCIKVRITKRPPRFALGIKF
jgi:hypothetical protein